MSNGKLLEAGTTKSDDAMIATVSKTQVLAGKASLSWVSTDVLVNSVLATAVSGTVYAGYHNFTGGAAPPIVGINIHLVTGFALGLLLVTRISLGMVAVKEAYASLQDFNKACRTLVVTSSHVAETLTISAGAELEKKAVANFRYELVRLLNLAVFSNHLMLKGLKMASLPKALLPSSGSSEAEVLTSCNNPTVMVIKLIAKLIDQQREAQRISPAQTAAMLGNVDSLLVAYHSSLAQSLAPSTSTLHSFSKFAVMFWVFTAAPVLALEELHELDEPGTIRPSGLILSLAYTFFAALFFFGLYEAGTTMEKPVRAVTELTDLDDLKYSLSADLTDLVDEDTVPYFLKQ